MQCAGTEFFLKWHLSNPSLCFTCVPGHPKREFKTKQMCLFFNFPFTRDFHRNHKTHVKNRNNFETKISGIVIEWNAVRFLEYLKLDLFSTSWLDFLMRYGMENMNVLTCWLKQTEEEGALWIGQKPCKVMENHLLSLVCIHKFIISKIIQCNSNPCSKKIYVSLQRYQGRGRI